MQKRGPLEEAGSVEASTAPASSLSPHLLHRIPFANEAQLPLEVVILGPRVDAERLKDGGRKIADVNGPFARVGADAVGGADHLAAAHAAAGKGNGVAVAPVVPAPDVVRVVGEGDSH